MRTISTITLGAVLLLAFLSAVAVAQMPVSGSASRVSVSLEGSVVRIQVASTTPLSQVLNTFCLEERIQCAGSEVLSAFSVAEMTISGTAEQVIANLLEGTGMNYSISRTASGVPSKLTLLGRAIAGTDSENEPVTSVHGDAQVAQHVDSEPTPFAEPESAEESARSERVMELIFGGATPTAGGANIADTSAGNLGGPIQGASSKVPEYLPFPDQFGNPIRTTPAAPATFLPFPDHNGNPIPVAPVPVHGPPFPLTSQ